MRSRTSFSDPPAGRLLCTQPVCPWPLRAASGACDYAFESQVPEVARGRLEPWASILRETIGQPSSERAGPVLGLSRLGGQRPRLDAEPRLPLRPPATLSITTPAARTDGGETASAFHSRESSHAAHTASSSPCSLRLSRARSIAVRRCQETGTVQ